MVGDDHSVAFSYMATLLGSIRKSNETQPKALDGRNDVHALKKIHATDDISVGTGCIAPDQILLVFRGGRNHTGRECES
jgi:hypothetical protein